MSQAFNVFRIPVPAELLELDVYTLANLSHKAEESDDDILLMQVAALIESRGEDAKRIYRDAYCCQLAKRMEAAALARE